MLIGLVMLLELCYFCRRNDVAYIRISVGSGGDASAWMELVGVLMLMSVMSLLLVALLVVLVLTVVLVMAMELVLAVLVPVIANR